MHAIGRRLLERERGFAVGQAIVRGRGRDRRHAGQRRRAVVVRLSRRVRNLDLRFVDRIMRLEREVVGDRQAEAQRHARRPVLVEGELIGARRLVIDVETGGDALVPAVAVLALRGRQFHILAAPEEVGLGDRDFGDRAVGGRIAA